MDDRRDLTFERIEDVMPEVERLLAGHPTVKGWTLGQILHHLSSAIHLSLQGPGEPPEASPGPELERKYQVRRRRYFQSGRFPTGLEVPDPSLRPPEDADARVQAESLRAALRLLDRIEGPTRAHPLLGPLSAQDWRDFHRIHCAHHLSFARTTSAEGDPS